MVFLDKKGKMAIAFLVGAIIIILSMVIIFFVIKPLPEGVVNKVTLCRITNTIKSPVFLTRLLPNACLPTTVNDPLSGSEKEVMEEMAGYTRDCWTMWLGGKKDFNFLKVDEVYTCYVFKIEDKEVSVEDFTYYLQTRWNGKKSDKNSYWNYIQQGSGIKNICFDKKLLEKGFKKDENYYIRFRDDRQGVRTDQILISNDKTFEGGWSGGSCLPITLE